MEIPCAIDTCTLPDRRLTMNEFRLDLDDERLWQGDRQVRIGPKAFELLCLFVRHKNRLLTKDTILDEIWSDLVVTEGLVKEYVSDLRHALGDDPKNARYIETVRGRGYRFLGGVQIVGATALPDKATVAVLPLQ